MPNLLLIGFKDKLSTAQADEKSIKPTYYFQFNTTAHPSINTLKEIVYLLRKIYPITAFSVSRDNVNLTVHENYHHFSNEDAKHTLLVKNQQYHEVHTGLLSPSDKIISAMAEPTVEVVNEATQWVKPRKIREGFENGLFTNTVTRLDLNTPKPDQKEYNDDEDLYPALSLLTISKSRIDNNKVKLTSINERCEQIKKLLTDTQAISAKSLAESKGYDGEFEILANIIDAEQKNYTAHLTTFASLKTDMASDYKNLMNNAELRKIRFKLAHSMQLCALAYSQKVLNNKTTSATVANFNDQFSQIATVELTDSQPVLRFNADWINLNFSELRELANQMLAKFYKNSSWLFWGVSDQKTALLKFVNESLADFTLLNEVNNTFNWEWMKLREAAACDDTQLKAENEKFNSILNLQRERLAEIDHKLIILQADIAQLKLKAEQEEAKLKRDHSSLTHAVTEAKQNTHTMQQEYLTLEDQSRQLQQTLLRLIQLSKNPMVPYAALTELIATAEEQLISITLQHEIANKDPGDFAKVDVAAKNTAELKREFASKYNSFTQMIKPLKDLNTLTAAMETQLTSQQSTITAKDNLISVTRKFANMLADVKYFSSLVSWGWGGVNLTVDGITYTVPTSYKDLVIAKESILREPMDYNNAIAFWTQAKAIEIRAQQRGSHRLFFHQVRSSEMSLLQNLIRGLDIHSLTFADDVDGKLDQIKSNWRSDMEHRTITVKPDASLPIPPKKRRHVNSASASASSDSINPSISLSSMSNRSS